MKNIVASTAVARDRKFAEPVAPKRLEEAPPPKPEPMSAPLPCWSSTRPMIASATTTCITTIRLVQNPIASILSPSSFNGGCPFLPPRLRSRPDDGEGIPPHPRSTPHQAARHVPDSRYTRPALRLLPAPLENSGHTAN